MNLQAPKISRRSIMAAMAVLPAAGVAQQPASRHVKLIVPSAPGSSTDLTARILAEGLRKELGLTIVIENKAGASGSIGSEALAKSTPDGLTVGLLPVGALAINQSLYSNLRYDPAADFAPIAFGGYTPSVLVVQASSPYKSVADLVAAAKRTPDKLNYASAGNGTTSHIAGEVINSHAGVKVHHVPFKSGEGLTALLSGVVDFTFYHPISVLPHVKEGRLRALAVSSAKRASGLPNVPTMIEQGFQGFDLTAWYAFVGPRGMSPEVIRRYATAVEAAFRQPGVAKQMAEQGVEFDPMDGGRLESFLSEERRKWARLVKVSGATLG